MKQNLLRSLLLTTLLCAALPAWSQTESSLLDKAQNAFSRGAYQDAIGSLESFLRLNPKDLKALQLLAESYLKRNEIQLAEATLESALPLERNHERTHFLFGQLRLQQKEYLKARSEFRSLIYLNKANQAVYLHLAQTAQALGEQTELAEALTKGLELSKEKTEDRARLLLFQAKLNSEPEKALLELSDYILGPELKKEVQQEKFRWLAEQNQFRKIIDISFESLSEAAKDQNTTLATAVYADLLRWLGKSQNPDLDQTYLLQQMEKLHSLYPNDTITRQQLISHYQRLKQPENLLALYREELISKGADLDPLEQAQLFRNIADLHLQMGYLQFAYDNYLRAIDKVPADFHSRLRVGVIYLTAKDYKEAIKTFEKILVEQPVLYEARLYLAFAQAFNQEPEKAKQSLAAVPENFEPNLQVWLKSLIAYQNTESMTDIWKQLLPEFRDLPAKQ
ncbi:hypothetical protein COW36_20220 [bacterium (Candidatus Blackallbacteria) CG17_big_fil_post_rev_8_21_14_2_50_48_46]|uniref:Tetratricopeptide repeat protein n=1 Tax=bacterium (Candidatus Blackallbacteria) CG17_big_fil_post_rev_8_21_14_2_50_48_46 TaxID=2014261 RepID=A0A2M7FZA9_9BACT|nr:MAG: hypothetical protein COW64_22545 [bacterium (Candidatus Blackallbacteria) CG18_big_fil_WC_8_21_14_2_50_49_26]PIW14734.1 MAG: hypothetical protein COW36_20220 [bacterium (Candidatus Blackallbacteria) CG17_big_fil_post_rev_8_21_14_2_50_48_46]PIW50836.1 MAG: hypothetical protein COW20_01035 [bacterium (Candidatus Blackallbacteria) CG13_big_fil_rev_8_21_14_2_50_49_14]